jgi:hypothetical protein
MSRQQVVASGLTFENFKTIRFAEERHQEPDLIAEDCGLREEEFLALPIEEQARRWEAGSIGRITEEWAVYYPPETASNGARLPAPASSGAKSRAA